MNRLTTDTDARFLSVEDTLNPVGQTVGNDLSNGISLELPSCIPANLHDQADSLTAPVVPIPAVTQGLQQDNSQSNNPQQTSTQQQEPVDPRQAEWLGQQTLNQMLQKSFLEMRKGTFADEMTRLNLRLSSLVVRPQKEAALAAGSHVQDLDQQCDQLFFL